MNKKSHLKKFNCAAGDTVILQLLECRDDEVHCFQVAQKAEVILEDILFNEKYEFYYPVLKNKKGKRINGLNEFLGWKLYKNNKLILEHKYKNIIVPKTYTRERIKEIRIKLFQIQQIK